MSLFPDYLPRRYQAEAARVVDSNGKFGDQIDVVVFDRQYSPFIFHIDSIRAIPAEIVYAVFEAKQTINATLVEYARKKVSSVRELHRTSLPIQISQMAATCRRKATSRQQHFFIELISQLQAGPTVPMMALSDLIGLLRGRGILNLSG